MKNDWISKIKEARNLKNLTLESCSKEINIPVEFLSNLETANFKKLPPPVFTKFHINNYFLYLGLNPEDCLIEYENFLTTNDKKNSEKELKKEKQDLLKRRYLSLVYVLGFSISIVFIYFFLFGFENSRDENATSDQILMEFENDPAIKNNFSINAEKKEEPDIIQENNNFLENPITIDFPLKINIEIDGESMVIIEDKNEVILYELMQTGSYELIGNPPFEIRIGFAPAVKIFLNNQEINLAKFINKNSNSAAFYTIDGLDVEKIRN